MWSTWKSRLRPSAAIPPGDAQLRLQLGKALRRRLRAAVQFQADTAAGVGGNRDATFAQARSHGVDADLDLAVPYRALVGALASVAVHALEPACLRKTAVERQVTRLHRRDLEVLQGREGGGTARWSRGSGRGGAGSIARASVAAAWPSCCTTWASSWASRCRPPSVSGAKAPAASVDLASRGEGACAERSGQACRFGVGVDAHVGEVATEAVLERRACTSAVSGSPRPRGFDAARGIGREARRW